MRQEILERMGWQFYRIWSTDWFRNKSVEQRRLLEVAESAIKNPTKSETKPKEVRPSETFEEVSTETHFEFPPYKAANINEICRKHRNGSFKEIVKDILKIESPLSEELLLRRTVGYFDREKVTSVVQQVYEREMRGCQQNGIIRRNGFLYLDDGKEIVFRRSGDLEREIKQIAPEELAAGIFEILRQNVSADKSGLYRTVALQCGFSRVGKTACEALDNALRLLEDRVVEDGERISLK